MSDIAESSLHDSSVAGAGAVRAAPVSIVVSNFNYGRFLRSCVQSALRQDHPDVEVIVVDDGSTDHSAGVLDELQSDYPQLVVLRQENGGQAAAMNAGYERARGEWVAFLDSDDVLDASAVSRALAAACDGDAVVQFLLRTIDANGADIGLHPFCHILEGGDLFGQICASGHFRFMPTSGNLFRRRDLERMLPIPEPQWRICADTYLILAAATQGRVRTLAEVLGSYRIHDANQWFEDKPSEARTRQIVRNHLVVWGQLLERRASWPAGYGDFAGLSLVRRILVSLFHFRDKIARDDAEVARLWPLLRRYIARASVPLGEKALHLMMWAAVRWNRAGLFRALTTPTPGRAPWLSLRRWQSPRRHDWLGAAALPADVAELPLGRALDFGQGGSGRGLQHYGFGLTENWRSWSSAERAGLVFRLPADAEDVFLSIDIVPYVCAPRVTAQRIELRANGRLVFEGSFSARGAIAFRLGRDCVGDDEVVRLEFSFPDAVVPALLDPTSQVTRITAIGISSITASIPAPARRERHSPLLVGEHPRGAVRLAPYLHEGWVNLEDAPRLGRRVGRIRFSMPNPVMDRFVIKLEFERVPPSTVGDWTVGADLAGIASDAIDLRDTATLLLVVPRGKAPASGLLDIVCKAGDILPVPGFDEDAPGPRLKSIALQHFELGPGKVSLWRSYQIVDFSAEGNGRRFQLAGWHAPAADGVWSSETRALLGGYYFEAPGESFLTLRVRSWPADAGPRQRLRIFANGLLVADSEIDALSDVLAIIPAGHVGADCYLKLELECRYIGSVYLADLVEPLSHVGFCLERLSLQPLGPA